MDDDHVTPDALSGADDRTIFARLESWDCPGCGRIMSDREAAEQGACNDCAGRDDVSPGYADAS